jgi:proteasome lid subunit RPN8/RPN11
MKTELPARIQRLSVPQDVIDTSRTLLEPFRKAGVEGCLLWFGTVESDDECRVTLCVCPDQESSALSYRISAESMRAVRKQVREQRLLMLIQIHTHPRDAFFSEWDELNALNKAEGALNLVLPNYGKAPWLDPRRVCMVEMNDKGRWIEWRDADWRRLLLPGALVSHG